MRNTSLRPVLCLALLAGTACAQRLQNVDMVFSMGPFRGSQQVIAGSNVVVSASTGASILWSFGYQVARTSAASLWIDLPFMFTAGGSGAGSIGGSFNTYMSPYTPGFRFMVPVQQRVSIYGIAGGGFGFFGYPTIKIDSGPTVSTNTTLHGVFEFGGGIDIRLTQHLSIRGEARDYMTGVGLSGATGHQHLVPLIGVAFHN